MCAVSWDLVMVSILAMRDAHGVLQDAGIARRCNYAIR
jgi:hypothetical protein